MLVFDWVIQHPIEGMGGGEELASVPGSRSKRVDGIRDLIAVFVLLAADQVRTARGACRL